MVTVAVLALAYLTSCGKEPIALHASVKLDPRMSSPVGDGPGLLFQNKDPFAWENCSFEFEGGRWRHEPGGDIEYKVLPGRRIGVPLSTFRDKGGQDYEGQPPSEVGIECQTISGAGRTVAKAR